jgi:hypothetical protein
MKEEQFDQFLKKTIQKLPECSPSDDFVNKVMNACYLVEIKEPFNIFVWIREKQSKLVIRITQSIIGIFDNLIEDYKQVEMGVVPIQ